MGMFDTIVVKKSVLRELFDEEDSILKKMEELSKESEYFDFQTKDLENFLHTFYIEEDHKLYVEKYSYKEEKMQDKVFCNTTAYVDFYDSLGEVGDSLVFITFTAHIVDGVVNELHLKEIEETNIKKLEEEQKKHKERIKFLESLFCYRLAFKIRQLLYDVEHWVRKYFRTPLESVVDKMIKNAEQKYEQRKL